MSETHSFFASSTMSLIPNLNQNGSEFWSYLELFPPPMLWSSARSCFPVRSRACDDNVGTCRFQQVFFDRSTRGKFSFFQENRHVPLPAEMCASLKFISLTPPAACSPHPSSRCSRRLPRTWASRFCSPDSRHAPRHQGPSGCGAGGRHSRYVSRSA